MAIQILGKVLRLPDGSEAGPYEIVSGMTPAQEAALIQGGDAVAAGSRALAPAFFDTSVSPPVLLQPNGTPALVSGGGIAVPFVVNNRDGMGRVTSYAAGDITYTITYGAFGVSTISGNGLVRTIARDTSGLITGVADA